MLCAPGEEAQVGFGYLGRFKKDGKNGQSLVFFDGFKLSSVQTRFLRACDTASIWRVFEALRQYYDNGQSLEGVRIWGKWNKV